MLFFVSVASAAHAHADFGCQRDRLAAPWRWGGHQVDIGAQMVHFTFVNRHTDARWTADVSFE